MKIELTDIRILKSELIEGFLDDQRWGFLIDPVFDNGNTEVKIVFDLLIPVEKTKYVQIKSGAVYSLKGFSKTDFAGNIKFVETLVQQSMYHTSKMFYQKYPQHLNIKINVIDQNYFTEDLIRQLTDSGVLGSTLREMGLEFKVKIVDIPLIGITIESPYQQIKTTAFIKEHDHKNYISREIWEKLRLKEVKPEFIIADVKLNHEKSPTLILGFDINDEETTEKYPVVISENSLNALGVKVAIYTVNKEMTITIPIPGLISDN